MVAKYRYFGIDFACNGLMIGIKRCQIVVERRLISCVISNRDINLSARRLLLM